MSEGKTENDYINYIPLFQAPTNIQAYYLGFNIFKEVVTEQMIKEKIKMLIQKGPEKYFSSEFFNTFRFIPSFIENLDFKNDSEVPKDIFQVPLNQYLPSDILWYCEETKVHLFSRADIPALIKEKKNPYNNAELPFYFIKECQLISQAEKELKLPECDTAVNLINNLISGNVQASSSKNRSLMPPLPERPNVRRVNNPFGPIQNDFVFQASIPAENGQNPNLFSDMINVLDLFMPR